MWCAINKKARDRAGARLGLTLIYSENIMISIRPKARRSPARSGKIIAPEKEGRPGLAILAALPLVLWLFVLYLMQP
jgi:hypothetical protein